MKALLFFAAVFFYACRTVPTVPVSSHDLEGSWVLWQFTPGNKPIGEVFGDRRPELHFQTADQKLTGTTGCNRLTGGYTAKGTNISFKPLALTRMGCPGYNESVFTDALRIVNRFTIQNNQLRLMHDNNTLMVFNVKSQVQ